MTCCIVCNEREDTEYEGACFECYEREAQTYYDLKFRGYQPPLWFARYEALAKD